MEQPVFTKKIAREIAKTSFGYVIDCLKGVSDSGYDLSTDVVEFEQNFEEDLEAKGIKPTTYKVKVCRDYLKKMFEKAEKQLDKIYDKS